MANVNKTVDVDALELLCDKLDCGDANHRATAAQIRKAMNGAKPQLPEGIEWPRDKNGDFIDLRVMYTHGYGALERVTFFPTPEGIKSFVMSHDGMYVECDKCEPCQPEVLDADGVPIKVGDTVWRVATGEEIKICSLDPDEIINVGGADGFWYESLCLTHRKPDTLESVVTEMLAEWDENNEEFLDMDSYFARFRKLVGGE